MLFWKYCIFKKSCQVHTKATQTLINKQMNFGLRVAFDYGNCTGPSCRFDWECLDDLLGSFALYIRHSFNFN